MEKDIDFVLTWVDGADADWLKKKASYLPGAVKNDARFRDWGILKYWFRAVEAYAPWVRKIFLITDNQCPDWLNLNYAKLVLVDHKDYIPKKYLPTFNSNCIEVNMHRIKGLSECFVSFNDDMFINQPVTPEYYFQKETPCDAPYEHVFDGKGYHPSEGWGISVTDYMNVQVLNAHFDRKCAAKSNKRGWYGAYLGYKYRLQSYIIKWFRRREFQHLYTPHNEKAFLKSTYYDVWDKEPSLMDKTCSRFRELTNLNIYLMRFWQLASNKFYPVNQLRAKQVVQLGADNLDQVERLMFDNQVKSLCLNDSSDLSYEDYESLKPRLSALFERKLPTKSQFEV